MSTIILLTAMGLYPGNHIRYLEPKL
uniref:Uncharacterized protein n=1 Tax=Arundo donax TaxID=35708 RepID=A0A0A8YGS7_ARUDO